jgi:lipopolysaccharide export system protein LptA
MLRLKSLDRQFTERGLMLILNFKRLLLKINVWLLIDFIVLVGAVFLSADISCAQYSIFGAETFDSKNIEIKADETSFDKKNSGILASGNVQIVLKLKNGETVVVEGSFAKYSTITENGKIWGKNTGIKYYAKGSSSPVIMRAKEIQFDKSGENIKAYHDVVVESSSGTIRADNALFYQKTSGATFEKDKTRPVASFMYDGKKQVYTADKMIFYYSKDARKVLMEGDVKGTIEMEMEGNNDTKN